MDQAHSRTRQAALVVLKVAVSTFLIAFLLSRIGGKVVISQIMLSDPVAFIASAFMYLAASYVSTLRWKLFIPCDIPPPRLFSMYMIGAFFNTCMPGIIGGDAVKAFYLSRAVRELSEGQKEVAQGERKHEGGETPGDWNVIAVASTFFDRYVGLSALIAINIIAYPFGYAILRDTPFRWFPPILFLLFLIGSGVLFGAKLGGRFDFLRKTYQYFDSYRSAKVLMKSFLLSLVVQALGIISAFVIARGLSLDISLLTFCLFLPLIILISMIPLSISGIGVREGAFVYLLGSLGYPTGQLITLSLLWFISIVAASAYGLFSYLRYRSRYGSEPESPGSRVV